MPDVRRGCRQSRSAPGRAIRRSTVATGRPGSHSCRRTRSTCRRGSRPCRPGSRVHRLRRQCPCGARLQQSSRRSQRCLPRSVPAAICPIQPGRVARRVRDVAAVRGKHRRKMKRGTLGSRNRAHLAAVYWDQKMPAESSVTALGIATRGNIAPVGRPGDVHRNERVSAPLRPPEIRSPASRAHPAPTST